MSDLILFFGTSFVFIWLISPNYRNIQNRLYSVKAYFMGSFPNFRGHIGHRWTSSLTLFQKLRDGEVFIDKFRFNYRVKNRFNIFLPYGFLENKRNMLKASELTKGSLLIGSMGSGKTEFILNILAQKFYNRVIIHDIKGDFTSKLFKNRDIIFNPYDSRAKVWNIFDEEVELIDTFFLEMIIVNSGKDPDFFSNSSKDRFFKTFKDVFFLDIDNSLKWKKFIENLYIYFDEMLDKTQKQGSEKDIVSTMKMIIEPLELMAYLIDNGAKTFSFKSFFKTKRQVKLFLLSNTIYSSKLKIIFIGFLACLSKYHASKEDTKDDFTLYLLDEYLSLIDKLTDDTINILHTLIRSKGGMLMSAVQLIPKDEAIAEKLTSSLNAIYIFASTHKKTIDDFQKTIGEVEYIAENQSSKKLAEDDKHINISSNIQKTFLMNNEMINSLEGTYSHVTFFPKKSILYIGYTPPTNIKNSSSSFEKRDLSEFYKNGIVFEKIDISKQEESKE